MHFYYAFLAIDFAFGIHGLVPGQQPIKIAVPTAVPIRLMSTGQRVP